MNDIQTEYLEGRIVVLSGEKPPQPTHNAPKPPEEGDGIGGEGGGV